MFQAVCSMCLQNYVRTVAKQTQFLVQTLPFTAKTALKEVSFF